MADLPAKKQEEETKLHEEEEDDKKESTTLLSHTRVRRIIKSDPDTKQIANDSVFLICRATVRNSGSVTQKETTTEQSIEIPFYGRSHLPNGHVSD